MGMLWNHSFPLTEDKENGRRGDIFVFYNWSIIFSEMVVNPKATCKMHSEGSKNILKIQSYY